MGNMVTYPNFWSFNVSSRSHKSADTSTTQTPKALPIGLSEDSTGMASRVLHTTFSPGEPTHASDFPTAAITGQEDAFELHSVDESDQNRSPMIIYHFSARTLSSLLNIASHFSPAISHRPARSSLQTDIGTPMRLVQFAELTRRVSSLIFKIKSFILRHRTMSVYTTSHGLVSCARTTVGRERGMLTREVREGTGPRRTQQVED